MDAAVDQKFQTVKEFVRTELCEKNHLEKDAFQMGETVIKKKGETCGIYFCIYGPRNVRLTAVWDLQSNSVYFYDSLGRRAATYPTPQT